MADLIAAINTSSRMGLRSNARAAAAWQRSMLYLGTIAPAGLL